MISFKAINIDSFIGIKSHSLTMGKLIFSTQHIQGTSHTSTSGFFVHDHHWPTILALNPQWNSQINERNSLSIIKTLNREIFMENQCKPSNFSNWSWRKTKYPHFLFKIKVAVEINSIVPNRIEIKFIQPSNWHLCRSKDLWWR